MPDTPIPPSIWDDCLTYDQALMEWTTAFVEDSLVPAAVRLVGETAPRTSAGSTKALNSTKLFMDMYQAFKGEGMSLLTICRTQLTGAV